jgi:hypothetical protein
MTSEYLVALELILAFTICAQGSRVKDPESPTLYVHMNQKLPFISQFEGLSSAATLLSIAYKCIPILYTYKTMNTHPDKVHRRSATEPTFDEACINPTCKYSFARFCGLPGYLLRSAWLRLA